MAEIGKSFHLVVILLIFSTKGMYNLCYSYHRESTESLELDVYIDYCSWS